jgi:hypothetical protein
MSKIDGKKVSKKNQLHDIIDWDVNNILFGDPEYSTVPDSSPPISFVRIPILTTNQKFDDEGQLVVDSNGVVANDDTVGDAVLGFDRMFSFGVSETTSPETKVVTGHSMSFAMWSREGAQEREINATRKIEGIIEKCKEHLLLVKNHENMKKIKKNKIEMGDLKDMDKLLYWKLDDENEKVIGQGPTFSPKLIEYKAKKDAKTGKERPYSMSTVFYSEDDVDENGNPVELSPLDFLSTDSQKCFCYARPAVKFESIFISSKVTSIQCKLTEADVQRVQSGPQRLLHGRHKINVSTKTIINKSSKLNPLLSAPVATTESSEKEGENDNKSTNDDDELKPDSPVVDKKKKVVKKKKSEE